MRNVGLISAAVIAMAAMAGTVAAAAPPVMQSQGQQTREELIREFVLQTEDAIRLAVRLAEQDGLSGEAAQQSIERDLKIHLETLYRGDGEEFDSLRDVALTRARRSLINGNQLRSGSDGDLAVSALLAAREAEERSWAERNHRSRGGYDGGRRGYDRGRGGETLQPRQAPAAGQGSPTAGDADRNVPGNAAAGQPATDAGTTGIRRSRATYDSDLDDGYDPDLDDEAGEPD